MRRIVRALTLLFALALFLTPGDADARKKRVVWTEVAVKDKPGLEAMMRQILEKEGRRADWGKKRKEPVEAELVVKELHAVHEGDVVKVTCTAVGKIKGLGAARSKFSYSGLPHEQAKLEKHVLELVARGIVTRLADMAKADVAGWKVASGP